MSKRARTDDALDVAGPEDGVARKDTICDLLVTYPGLSEIQVEKLRKWFKLPKEKVVEEDEESEEEEDESDSISETKLMEKLKKEAQKDDEDEAADLDYAHRDASSSSSSSSADAGLFHLEIRIKDLSNVESLQITGIMAPALAKYTHAVDQIRRGWMKWIEAPRKASEKPITAKLNMPDLDIKPLVTVILLRNVLYRAVRCLQDRTTVDE